MRGIGVLLGQSGIMVRVVIILSRRCIIEVVTICVKVGVLDWGILMR